MEIEQFVGKLFQDLGFSGKSDNFEFNGLNCSVSLYTRDNQANFLIRIDETSYSLIEKFIDHYQGFLFNWAKEKFSTFSENTTKDAYLTVLIKRTARENFSNRTLINIEEDAFFFKKYVLSYSDDEFKSLMGKIEQDNIPKGLGELALNQQIFEEYSKGKSKEAFPNLLYKLFIKIPSLPLPTKAKDFEGLQDRIAADLSLKSLEQLHKDIILSLDSIDENKIDLNVFKKLMGKK